MCTQSSQKGERCPSTWRVWGSEMWLTSEDQEVCWSTRGKVWLRTFTINIWAEFRWMYLHSGHTLHLHLLPTGRFAIQADKKAPAETKTARTLGLIAGGTGRASFSSFLVIMKPYDHLNQLSSSLWRHYASVAADSWRHQKPKWHDDMQPAVCQPGWCSIRKGVVAN